MNARRATRCSLPRLILCLIFYAVLAGCATQPPFAHPTYSGQPVRAGYTVYVMKTNGDVVTFRVTNVAQNGLQGSTRYVANTDMLMVVIVDFGRGHAAAGTVISAVEAADVLAKALKGIQAASASK